MEKKHKEKWDSPQGVQPVPEGTEPFEEVTPGKVEGTNNGIAKPPEMVTRNPSQSKTAKYNIVMNEAVEKQSISKTTQGAVKKNKDGIQKSAQ